MEMGNESKRQQPDQRGDNIEVYNCHKILMTIQEE